MGTRAVVTFIDADNTFHVYKHWDGDPQSILHCIECAKAFAWPLPRFEADEFAAAFVAANKEKGGGDIRLTHTYEDHYDLEFRYEVRLSRMKLDVRVFVSIFDEERNVSGWNRFAAVPETEAV